MQEDHVSMGGLGNKGFNDIRECGMVFGNRAISSCSSTRIKLPLQGGLGTRVAKDFVRKHIMFLEEDRELHDDINIAKVIQGDDIIKSVEKAIGIKLL